MTPEEEQILRQEVLIEQLRRQLAEEKTKVANLARIKNGQQNAIEALRRKLKMDEADEVFR